VGNGKVTEEGKKIPLDVKAGDKILFGKYSGSEVKVDDEEYLILREEDVLAIIE
jgi:chaperonin GroES